LPTTGSNGEPVLEADKVAKLEAAAKKNCKAVSRVR
jgi:hypothetical protein